MEVKELLEYMVKELVDNPDDVDIEEEEEDEKTIIFTRKRKKMKRPLSSNLRLRKKTSVK